MAYSESAPYQEIRRICSHPDAVDGTRPTHRSLHALMGLVLSPDIPFTRQRAFSTLLEPRTGSPLEVTTHIVDCGTEADIAHVLGFNAVVGRIGIALSQQPRHSQDNNPSKRGAAFSLNLDDVGDWELNTSLQGPFNGEMAETIQKVVSEWGIDYSYSHTAGCLKVDPCPDFGQIITQKLSSIE